MFWLAPQLYRLVDQPCYTSTMCWFRLVTRMWCWCDVCSALSLTSLNHTKVKKIWLWPVWSI